MNPTETKAYNWIRRQGADQIVYQATKSPDFLADIGNFEVKLATAKGKVIITRKQLIVFSLDINLKFLIYTQNSESDEPTAILSYEKLRELYNVVCMPVNARVKNITIRDDQAQWVDEKHLNLSRFVQAKLDEEMKK